MVLLPSVHLGTSPTIVAIIDPERGAPPRPCVSSSRTPLDLPLTRQNAHVRIIHMTALHHWVGDQHLTQIRLRGMQVGGYHGDRPHTHTFPAQGMQYRYRGLTSPSCPREQQSRVL